MDKKNLKILTNIIGGVESGGQIYGNRNYASYAGPGKNTANEKTCTLGWAGNYGERARKLCKMILDKDPAAFRKADTANIETKLSVNWEATQWHPTTAQKNALIAIITTDAGKSCQDELFQELATTYIKYAEEYGITDVPAQMMWVEIEHLGGLKPVKRIFDRAAKPYTPDSIFTSLLLDQKDTSNNNQVGDKIFQSRHECCVKWIKKYVTGGQTMNETAYKQAKKVVDFVKSRYQKNQYTQSSLRYQVENGWSDCSSLVRAAYLKIGINIGDWTGAQVLKGRNISIKTTNTTRDTTNMQIGDLVFFKNPNHVEMYVGGDLILGHGSGVGPNYHDINTYRQGDFWQVRRYIDDIGTITEVPNEKPEETTSWKATGTATCSGGSVNVRSVPKKENNNILGQLGKGNRFEVNGEKSGDWVHIRVALNGKNVICWIHKDYVDYDQEESDIILTATTDLNVRVYAGKEYSKLKSYPSIPKGKQVVKLSEVKAKDGVIWYKIRISGKQGDKVGFASGKYLK